MQFPWEPKITTKIDGPDYLARLKGFIAQFKDVNVAFDEGMDNASASASGRITLGIPLLNKVNRDQAEATFLHEYGHQKLLGGLREYDQFTPFNHWMEFRSDTFAAAMQGRTKGIKGFERIYNAPQSETHPSNVSRIANMEQFDSVLREVGQDKTIPAKLAHLSREDQRLARKLLPFEIHSARTLNPNLKKRFNGSKS